MHYTVFDSPLGAVTIAAKDDAIRHVHLEGDRYFTAVPQDWIFDAAQPLLRQAQDELLAYFAGTRTTFSVPILIEGTPFQQKVWTALQTIPYGGLSTYAQVAEAIDVPKAVRAVGTAIGRNPLCVIIPCHRVLTSRGALGGYVAGLERKQRLLALEQQSTEGNSRPESAT